MDEKLVAELKTLPFEAALARLEAVVERMEGGGLSLDAMISSFEEGNLLAVLCGEKLSAVEKKIEILLRDDPKGPKWGIFNPGANHAAPAVEGGDSPL